MSEFSSIRSRIEPDIRLARMVQESRHLVATTHLDDLNPDQLAAFLRRYLRDRAQATQDIEDLTDDASDGVNVFLLGESRRTITIESEPDLPNHIQLGFHSDGSPCYDDDRICY